VYERKRVRAIEPAFLAHGWYYDEAVTAFAGGPGREGFDDAARFDAKVVDGAVDGTGKGIRAAAQRLRRARAATSATTRSASASAPCSSWVVRGRGALMH
jgi:hypothetical protein